MFEELLSDLSDLQEEPVGKPEAEAEESLNEEGGEEYEESEAFSVKQESEEEDGEKNVMLGVGEEEQEEE
jgi:hypothetical protein